MLAFCQRRVPKRSPLLRRTLCLAGRVRSGEYGTRSEESQGSKRNDEPAALEYAEMDEKCGIHCCQGIDGRAAKESDDVSSDLSGISFLCFLLSHGFSLCFASRSVHSHSRRQPYPSPSPLIPSFIMPFYYSYHCLLKPVLPFDRPTP